MGREGFQAELGLVLDLVRRRTVKTLLQAWGESKRCPLRGLSNPVLPAPGAFVFSCRIMLKDGLLLIPDFFFFFLLAHI